MEFYKEVARYRADIIHKRTGDHIDFKAVVFEGPSDGMFFMRYSHTFKAEAAVGFWYSDSFTGAQNADEAEIKVKSWADDIAESYEVGIWHEI